MKTKEKLAREIQIAKAPGWMFVIRQKKKQKNGLRRKEKPLHNLITKGNA